MRIYTRRGDDGTTALVGGGRVRKDDAIVELLGALDEAQAALGAARAQCDPADPLDDLLVDLERDLWVAMAEVAGAQPSEQTGSIDELTIGRLEAAIDDAMEKVTPTHGFAVPGESLLGASLDVARTSVRRAERRATAVGLEGSFLVTFLNRLSDLCWALARSADGSPRTHAGARVGRRSATLSERNADESRHRTGDAHS